MRLKTLASLSAILLLSGCSLLQQAPREVEIITKPVKLNIVQPTMPRPLDLKEPKWYVVSDRKIPKEDRTYLDKFIEEIKKKHGGDVVFVAMTVADYELMAYNTQEIKRYVSQLGEVIVYYRNVTNSNGTIE
jgi:F420-0:gamma-glutamyl ligase-like protein